MLITLNDTRFLGQTPNTQTTLVLPWALAARTGPSTATRFPLKEEKKLKCHHSGKQCSNLAREELSNVQGIICTYWECLQFNPSHLVHHKISWIFINFKDAVLYRGHGDQEGETIYLNMPEAPGNKMKANIIVERMTLVTYPKIQEKHKWSKLKGFEKWKKKEKKKPGSLCLILETYIMLTLRAGGQMVEAHTRNIKSIWNPLALLMQHGSCLEGKTISTQTSTNHSDSVTNWEILTASLSTGSWNGLSQPAQQVRQKVRRQSWVSLSLCLTHTHVHAHTHMHASTNTHAHMHTLRVSLYSDRFLPLESDIKWNGTWKAPSTEPVHGVQCVFAISSEE